MRYSVNQYPEMFNKMVEASSASEALAIYSKEKGIEIIEHFETSNLFAKTSGNQTIVVTLFP